MSYVIVKRTKHEIGRGSLASDKKYKTRKEAMKMIKYWNKNPMYRYLKLRPKKIKR